MFVVEGEQACDALDNIGVVAVGTVTGAKATPGRVALEALKGREVYLWPDKDEPGRKHMKRIANGLAAFGVIGKIITWPDASPKGDAADFVAAGGTSEDIEVLLGAARPWTPPSTNGAEPDPRPSRANHDNEGDIHLTDIGNAKRLVAHHGKDVRHCWPFKQWLVWDGIHWHLDDSGKVTTLAKSVVLGLYTEVSGLLSEAAEAEKQNEKAKADKLRDQADALWKHARKSEQAPRIAAMVELAKSESGIPILPNRLDRDPWLLNVENGTIDLRTGGLRPHC